MQVIDALPKPSEPFVEFAGLLRRHRFHISSLQTITFLQAIDLLGPASLESVRLAAHASFAPVPERQDELNALFRAHFYGETMLVPAVTEASVRRDESAGSAESLEAGQNSAESGRFASAEELLFSRTFTEETASLRRLNRELARALPKRRAFRRIRRRRGARIDLRRSMRGIVRNDGDLPRPSYSVRQTRPRKLVVLIDISGSMKQHTDAYLRFAHALMRQPSTVEIFTLGTRLTRITTALRSGNQAAALAAAAALVPDWDGGTRLGATLAGFLSSPRWLNLARGATVIVISDALERGDPQELVHAVARLRRLTWRLSWATPLAADPRFRPETAALRAILPDLDDLFSGADVNELVNFTLSLSRASANAETVWSKRLSL